MKEQIWKLVRKSFLTGTNEMGDDEYRLYKIMRRVYDQSKYTFPEFDIYRDKHWVTRRDTYRSIDKESLF